MLRYYPPTLNLRTFKAQFKELQMIDPETGKVKSTLTSPDEAQRLIDVERKKAIGKGPPKKGE
jgi:small subunit ribosomal protein S33